MIIQKFDHTKNGRFVILFCSYTLYSKLFDNSLLYFVVLLYWKHILQFSENLFFKLVKNIDRLKIMLILIVVAYWISPSSGSDKFSLIPFHVTAN